MSKNIINWEPHKRSDQTRSFEPKKSSFIDHFNRASSTFQLEDIVTQKHENFDIFKGLLSST